MKKEENNLDRLKGTNPFTVPEGYMEGLTERIMSQLPEKPEERAKRISLMDRVRPWLYMATVPMVVLRLILYWSGRKSRQRL